VTTTAPDADTELPTPTELRAMRIIRGVTQAEVGDAVGVPQVMVSKFEREVTDLDDDTVAEMHAFLREAER